MSSLWFLGIILAIVLIGTIHNFFEKKSQEKAARIFEGTYPNFIGDIDEKIKNISTKVEEDKMDYCFHISSFPSYGKCFCCEQGELILRKNQINRQYFIGCTSYYQAPRYYRGHRSSLKPCHFTFSII